MKRASMIFILMVFTSLHSTPLLHEGFEGSTFPPSGWKNVAVNGSYTWERHQGTYHPSGYNAHGGSYLAMFNSYSIDEGNSARLITDTVDLGSYSTATLKFWMFHDDGYSSSNDSIVVEIKKRSGGSWPSDWTALQTFKRYDPSGDSWQEHQIDLSSYTGDSIIIAFHAMSAYGNDLHIDDVSIEVTLTNDVGVTGIITKSSYEVNTQDTLWFIVKNFGTADQSNFYVVYQNALTKMKDSVLVSSLDSGATDTVFGLWTPTSGGTDTITAWTNLSNDEYHGNDTTSKAVNVIYTSDVGVLEVIAKSLYGKDHQDTLWFVVKNFGANNQSNFYVVYRNALTKMKDSVQVSSLTSGEIDTVNGLWTPSVIGSDTITAWTNLSNDQNHSNDTSSATTSVILGAVLIAEGFEGTFPPSEWQNVTVNGSYTWQKHEGTYHPSGYSAHGGSYVAMYNSYNASSGNAARLITDTLNLTGYNVATLSFWMFHDDEYSTKHDSLAVELKYKSSGSWSDWTTLTGYSRYDASGDQWKKHEISLDNYTGDSIIIAFHAISAYGNDIHIDDVKLVAQTIQNDLSVTGILKKSHYSAEDEDTLWFIVQNPGTNSQSNFYVVYQNALSKFKDSVLVSSLDSGAIDTVFGLWTPPAAGTDTLTAWTNLSSDERHSNDTSSTTVTVWPSGLHITESFESQFLPQNWSQDSSSNNIHWQRSNRTNQPYGYAPPDGNYLAFFESHSYASGSWARLITDTMDMTTDTAATVRFWMFHDSYNNDKNDYLVIEVKRRNAGTWPSGWTEVDTIYRYRSNNGWIQHTVDISQYTGDSVIVSFKAVSQNGSDIHIDKIEIYRNPKKDVGVTNLTSFTYHVNKQDSIGFIVRNYGSRTQLNVWVYYEIKSSKSIDSLKLDTLNVLSIDTIYASWTPTSIGYDTIVAWTKLTGDTITSNDSIRKIVEVTWQNVIVHEGFESKFPSEGWENEAVSGNWTWVKRHRTQNFGDTPPEGYYMAEFDATDYLNSARLITPDFLVPSDSSVVLEFQLYRYFDREPDSLVIEVKDVSGGSWQVLRGIYIHSKSGRGWERVRVPLGGFANKRIQVGLRGVYGDNPVYIDDITMFYPRTTDIAVSEIIDKPYYKQNHSDTIKFVVDNNGNSTLQNFYLHYRFNSSSAKGGTDSVLINSLAGGRSDTVAVIWTPSVGYYDTVTAWVSISGDTVSFNDTTVLLNIHAIPENWGIWEDFEQKYHGFPPLGWHISDDDWYYYGGWAKTTVIATHTDTLSSPQFTVPANSRLKFQYSHKGTNADVTKILIDSTLLANLEGSRYGGWQWNYYDLSSLSGQTVKLHWLVGHISYTFNIDDIMVQPKPDYDPAALYVYSPTRADTFAAGSTVVFKGYFSSFGRNSATFKAKLRVKEPVGGKYSKGDIYADSTNVTVDPWDSTLVDFGSWTVRDWNYFNTLCYYEVEISANSSSDGDGDNNTAIDSFYVLTHEVHTKGSPTWILKDMNRGVTYNWVNLVVMNTDSVDTFALGDEGEAKIGLGRPVRINGTVYDSIIIGANGGIEFSKNDIYAGNSSLYTTEQNVFFAVLWDDLVTASDLSSPPKKLVYTRVWDDSTVIEWYHVTPYGDTTELTFEVIIYTPDGGHANIKYQYKDFDNYPADKMDATIGFQVAPHAINAAEYTHNETPFTPNWSNWAILCENPEISPATKDLGIYSLTDIEGKHVGDTDTVTVTVKNFGTEAASGFWVHLRIADIYHDSVYAPDTLDPTYKTTSKSYKFIVPITDAYGMQIYNPLAKVVYAGDKIHDNDSLFGDGFYPFHGSYWTSFDNTDFPYPGWAIRNYGGGSSWKVILFDAFDGLYSLEVYNNPQAAVSQYGGHYDWVFFPPIDVRPDTQDYFNFVAKSHILTRQMDIMIDTSGGAGINPDNYFLFAQANLSTQWSLHKCLLDQYDGKTVKMAIRYHTYYDDQFIDLGVIIDAVDISKVNDILAPQVKVNVVPHTHYYNGTADTVKVKLRDMSGVNVNSVTLYYRTNSGTKWSDWQSVQMTHNGDSVFTAVIPAQNSGTDVEWKIERADTKGNSFTTAPQSYRIMGEDEYRRYLVSTASKKEFYAKELRNSGLVTVYTDEEDYDLVDDASDFHQPPHLSINQFRSLLDSLGKHQRIIVSNYLSNVEMYSYVHDYKNANISLYGAIKNAILNKYGTTKGNIGRKAILLASPNWAEYFNTSALFNEIYHAKYVKANLRGNDLKDTLLSISGDPISNNMPMIIVQNTNSPDMLVPWGYRCVTASGDSVVVDSGWRFMTVKNGDSTNTAGGIAYVGVTYSLYYMPFNFGCFEDTTLIDTLINRIFHFDSTASPPNVIDWCKIDLPYKDTLAPGDTTDWLYVLAYENGLTNAKTDNRDSIVVEVGFGPKNSVPWLNSDWRWFRTYFDGTVDSMYRYKGRIILPSNLATGHYDFAFRLSVRDNGAYRAFYYADTNGHEDSAYVYTYDKTKAGDLWVAYEHDVSSDSIQNFSEGDTITSDSTRTPRVFLMNKGRSPASFQAFCYIINTTTGDTVYIDTLNFSNIPPDSGFWANFDSWTPPSFLMNTPVGNFRIVTFVRQTGENYTTNDTLTRNFNLLRHEIRDGYGMRSRDSQLGISYNWTEVSGMSGCDTLALGDEDSAWVHFGRTFYFYGKAYDSVKVFANGILSFKSSPDYRNVQLPDSTQKDLIAPFWEDLKMKENVSGGPDSLIYVKVWTDSTIVEYRGVRKLGSSRLFTFEVIFYTPGNASGSYIKFQYKDMSNYSASDDDATIGIQDSAGASGHYILYTFNEIPFTPNWSGGKEFTMALKDSKTNGWSIAFSPSEATGIGEEVKKPMRLFLAQNYPNPFVKSTTIRFGLPESKHVKLVVYNILGQRVKTLVDRKLPAGIYTITWDGTGDTGSRLGAGVYFYVLKVERRVKRRKMIILR